VDMLGGVWEGRSLGLHHTSTGGRLSGACFDSKIGFKMGKGRVLLDLGNVLYVILVWGSGASSHPGSTSAASIV